MLLALALALIISLVLAYCLPARATACITLAAVVTVAIGGGALLAKAFAVGALVAAIVWLGRRHLRRRAIERMPADVRLAAIPEAKAKQPHAERSRAERRAA